MKQPRERTPPCTPNKNCFRVIADAIRTPSRRFFSLLHLRVHRIRAFFAISTRARVRFGDNVAWTKRERTGITSIVRIRHMLRISFGVHDGIHVHGVSTFPDSSFANNRFSVCWPVLLPLLSIVDNCCQRAKSRARSFINTLDG